MAAIGTIESLADWELLWGAQKAEDAGALLIFKHSPLCPVSFAARVRFVDFVDTLPALLSDVQIYEVDVVNARPISRRIAADTGVQHESPQVLLISRGQNVLWHASHGDITQRVLEDALAAAKI